MGPERPRRPASGSRQKGILLHVARASVILRAFYVGLLACWLSACGGVSTGESALSYVAFSSTNARANLQLCLESIDSTALVQGRVLRSQPSMARPGKGVAYVDPSHGTCVMRVTDHDAEPPVGFARNDYARRQAFNADNTRLLIKAGDGFWHIYNATDFSWLSRLDAVAGSSEPQWHPSDPAVLWFMPDGGVGMRIMLLNIHNNQQQTVADMSSQLLGHWPRAMSASTRSEGSPSSDGRYWAMLVEDADLQQLGIFVWDLQEQRIIAWRDATEKADYITMSPSGRHVVVGWQSGVSYYDRLLITREDTGLLTEHSDVAVGSNGNDLLVSVDYRGHTGPLLMIDLDSQRRTDLMPTYVAGTATALHISGKAFDKPGWAIVSTYDYRGGGQQWLHEKIFAIELKAQPRIVQLAHHHSQRNTRGGTQHGMSGYFREPQASVSRDLTRISFSSNWMSDDLLDIDTYMISVPEGFLSLHTQ